ncbi:hypothetical protein F511_40626 [Dorcoceras hygrometricum]|uniref:Splicing factor 3B subunit 1-like n=1 Tax=Dorcoceras hygrometricum TaxID=472368 RepID=A0A2Z6ZZM8_9LAMI|nr:hypothetical protein F511_40626 [Dorcoceras hygrometricum]
MAYSYISNALQINFDSVLSIPDNNDMVNMFRALEATGLRGFLGCSSVLYEQELEQFFDTALIQYGNITCAVSGKYVAIFASRFAGVFNLPTDGLIDFSEVPNDLVLKARNIFSKSGTPVQFSCKKRLLKYEFHLLNDILAKAISVKAGSFDAVTHERFLMMTAIHFGVKINWSTILFEGDPAVTLVEVTIFPPLKILSVKTVHTYVATNKTIDSRGETEEPEVAKVAIVKRKTVSKKKSVTTVDKKADIALVQAVEEKAVSKKRPAVVPEAKIAKKKKTTSGKTVPKDQDLAIVSVALDVMPIKSVDPISAMRAAHPSPPKRKAPKRKLKLTPDSDEESVEKEFALETVVGEQKKPTSLDDVDTIIEEVTATEQMESDVVESDSAEDLARRTVVEEPVDKKSDDIQIVVAEGSLAATDEVVEPLSKVPESAVSPISEDESMTIEEHLTLIPDGMMLPSLTSAEPTKIKFSSTIEIRGVEDGDWYKKNLPNIAPTYKGKKYLEEPDTIQGHPAREQFQLVCGDIDFLILLRENVITEMNSFFHYFSLRTLNAMRTVKDILSKVEKMLSWVETDSLETAIHRRLFIIAKYREVLLRKFLVSRRTNLVLGLPTTVIDQQNLGLLSAAHQEAVRHLLRHMNAHGLEWTRPVSSMLFEEPNLERGFYIPRNHKTIFSTSWLRNLQKIEGAWVVEEGFNRLVCKCIKCVSSNSSSLTARVSITDLSPICVFFKTEQCMDSQPSIVKTWGWYRVCTEVLRYSMFGYLKPVSRFTVCTDIVPVGPVLGVFSIPRRVVDNVSYHIQILDSAPTDFVSSPPHQSSSSTSSMNFSDDILQGTTTAGESTPTAVQFSLPPAVSDSFTDLRTSMSRIISLQSKESMRLVDSHSEVLDKIKKLETTILEAFYQQNQSFHRLLTGIRQEAQNDTTALSLGVKAVRTQTTMLSTDQADACKEEKEQKAIIEDMDERLDTLRSEQLDFCAQAQENYNNLSSQLGELVAYINRGNDKKGEGSSSRQPQPQPDDPNRPSGGNANRGGGGGGSSASGRRDDRRSSSMNRGSGSSSAGGTYKKSADWWLFGKNQQ